MNIEMIALEILGLKTDLMLCVGIIQQLGCVHIDDIREGSDMVVRPLELDSLAAQRQEELSVLSARSAGLMNVLQCGQVSFYYPEKNAGYIEEIRCGINKLFPEVQSLTSRGDDLLSEQSSLPLYEATLRRILPLMPAAVRKPGNMVVVVLVNREHVAVLDQVGKQIMKVTGGTAELVAGDLDDSTRAMLIVFAKEYEGEIETLIGLEDISRLRLPSRLGGGRPDTILTTLQRREKEISQEIREIEGRMKELSEAWSECLHVWHLWPQEDLELFQVLSRFGETDMAFVLVGWVPVEKLEQVRAALTVELGEQVMVRAIPMTRELEGRAPVALKNPPPTRPFESLVKIMALPRYNHIDPTYLMAFFMPFFFGMILGDIGYGLLILATALILRKKVKPGIPEDILTILAVGSVWAVVFGFLYGELFGTLGENFGFHAIWLKRDSPEHLFNLLVMSVGIGAVHVTLGLVLGIWEAVRERSRSHLLERGGMLVGLAGLFLLVSVLVRVLPEGFMTPAIAFLIIGIVLLGASLGWLGIIMGPIEFIGLVGNILSYLRIAAIGLASVYLAKVANEMAGMIGNLVVGIILAILIHALNLVLGAFSPTIQSLRLHYVEFFQKFYQGGGRQYEPFQVNDPPGKEQPT